MTTILSACDGCRLDSQQSLVTKSAEQIGATLLSDTRTDDGGLRLNGKLKVALTIPWQWNKEVVLYDDVLRVGRWRYDKASMSVQTGVDNSHGLKQFTDKFDTARSYLIGASMSGNVAMALIKKNRRIVPAQSKLTSLYNATIHRCGAMSMNRCFCARSNRPAIRIICSRATCLRRRSAVRHGKAYSIAALPPELIGASWHDLRTWVETNNKP